MDLRRTYRRNRRQRKKRYRKPHFLNRRNLKRTDRFSPTLQSKIHTHIREIEFVRRILPVSGLVIECGAFDPHLMKNPMLANPKVRHWGYQKGPNYGFANTRAMVLDRDQHTCQLCGGKHKDSRLEVHHIIFRENGGSDEHTNLVTLCHTCHCALHHGQISEKKLKALKGKTKGQLKHSTQMNTIISQLQCKYPEAIITNGYITKENSIILGLKKDHHIDSGVIPSGGNPFTMTDIVYVKKMYTDG